MSDRRRDGVARGGPGGDDVETDGPTFEAPWQARAFATAVALTDREDLEWEAFQSELVAEIDAGSEAADDRSSEEIYYRQWLRALERVLVDRGLATPEEVSERAAAFQRGDRDASEFVEGDPHEHSDHSHDHSHGHSDHSHDHSHGHSDHSHGHSDHSHDHSDH